MGAICREIARALSITDPGEVVRPFPPHQDRVKVVAGRKTSWLKAGYENLHCQILKCYACIVSVRRVIT